MATISIAYTAVTGNTFTAAEFNAIWPGATITLDNSEVTTLKINDDAVTRDKIASNVAGTGLQQNANGSLEVAYAGGGLKGITTTNNAAVDITVTAGTSKINQRLTGTLAAAVNLIASLTSAVEGDEFNFIFSALTITAVNKLIIKNDVTALITFDEAGILNGIYTIVYTGSAWVLKSSNVTNTLA